MLIKQINFLKNLDREEGATIAFISEGAKLFRTFHREL